MRRGPGGPTITGIVKETDEAVLLERARNGDRAAIEELIQRHQNRIYRFGMKMCRHVDDAEDVLQDTLLTVAKTIGDFRGGSSLSTWLYTIARSFCIKKRRKSKFAPLHEHSLEQDLVTESDVLADSGKAPDEAALGNELRVALENALESLDPEQREVLLLRDVEGLKASEVGQVVGISTAAVKSRLHRARVRVRELLAPVLDAGLPAAPAPGECLDVPTLYSKQLEGEISRELCAQMEQHLQTCGRCRATCDSLRETLAVCRRLPAAPVPEVVQQSVRRALRDLLSERD